eukprot:CAMPEP_0118935210 /NCGR_PEP_ID=MMETSP1169-20130426/15150_1 /TAXON_ID=36882 /ORGANISM="Pyramimonas obovata, Strain CCMP722" /LENGTH=368 /DNA_ID=CAMNT_0006878207 /DNA_START=198 /DNA_END=1301 /DNA_ORIENTATION=-
MIRPSTLKPAQVIGLATVLLLVIFMYTSTQSRSSSGPVIVSHHHHDQKLISLTKAVSQLRQQVDELETTVRANKLETKEAHRGGSAVDFEEFQGEAPVANHVPLSQRSDIEHEVNISKGAQTEGHSWTNPDTKDTYMKMYNEYHRLRSGYNSCHGCRYLPALYKTFKFKSVFDAGCGTGYLVRELLRSGREAYGVEAASLPLETYASDLLENHTVFIRPLHQTPFKDEYFDFILSTEVFEHVPMADVDRSIKELTRVSKTNAKAFVTIGMGTSRFDTKEGRKKSEVAGVDMDFKFHETVQTRKWWLDTFCAFGWYEDVAAYKNIVQLMIKAGYPQNIPPRGWFPLTRGPVGSRPCSCTVAEGRKSAIW